jgi:hypothetical protein
MDDITKPTAPSLPRPIRPKYQVFVSSTFVDLHEERKAVTWEVLKAGHIPVGMENFSAYDDRGWKVINRTLETTDYYVLILAGRYGSIDSSIGKSWTEREYRRAIELGIPVLAFVREKRHVPGDQVDTDENATRLAALISDVTEGRHREMWTTPDDLRSKVGLALLKTITDDEADENARPGWYRGSQRPGAATTAELAQISSENRALRVENERLSALATAAKKETTFAIEVLDAEGILLPELTFKFVYREDPRHAAGAFTPMELSSQPTDPGPADLMWSSQMVEFNEEIEEYLATEANAEKIREYTLREALSTSTQVTFAIRSLAGPTARDVRCEIEFPEGFTLHCGELPHPMLPHDRPQRPRRQRREAGRGSAVVATFVGSARGGENASFMLPTTIFVPSPNTVSVDGTTVYLNASKLQHASRVVFARSADIVTVLTPQVQLHEGVFHYRILSDETKPQEGTIPFRIVYE